MARIEPPKLAAWMLEYLVPAAERNEAVAGDLEEHFRAGRSDGWYWRQVGAAISSAWAQYWNRRRAILLFALLWSMLAPAWLVVIDRAQSNSAFVDALWRMDWPFSTLANFGLWLLLNVPFFWIGILLFALWHGGPLDRKRVRQALLKAPLIFLPIYFATFVVLNLLAYPGPAIDRRTLTVLGEITDARRWALFMRIPYFLTTATAMWRVVPRFRIAAAEAAPAGGGWIGMSTTPAEGPAPAASPGFFALVVTAGLMNALLCGFLLCRLPDAHSPSPYSLLLRAACYVALGAIAGTAGAWIYWNNPASPFRDSAPVDFRLFALTCAAGWIWIPALVILYEQITPLTAIVAAIATFVLAAGLRRIPLDCEPAGPSFSISMQHSEEVELFSDPFLRPQAEGSGMFLAVLIYAAGFALASRSYLGASALLGLAAFLLGWRRTVQQREPQSHEFGRAALRLAIVALPAVLITAWALLSGVGYRNRMAVEAATQTPGGTLKAAERDAGKAASHGFGGYESVILWPYPEKEEIVTPMPAQPDLLAPGTTRPLVLRFNGPYWYIQPPDQRPGLDAHQAHGSPLIVRIAANNSLPLVMEARQRLSTSIPLAHCGRVVVELENRDPHLGVVAVVLLLEDSSSKGHPQLVVGRQQLITGEPETSGAQTFQFSLPLHGPIRRFDSIAVMFLPESGHQQIGPQIAVHELRLYPR